MKIAKVKITNFKCYEETFTLALNDGLNVIVGANESGKTTILEAIHLALTGLVHGRPLKNDLTSYMFNLAAQTKYVQSLATGSPLPAPTITIELFFSGGASELAELEGDGNSEKIKASGVVYRIEFDEENYKGPYEALVTAGELTSIPVEYYTVTMRSFARKGITSRSIPIKSALIDSSSARLQDGSDIYVSRIIRDVLEETERASISQAHRTEGSFCRGQEPSANQRADHQGCQDQPEVGQHFGRPVITDRLGEQPHDVHRLHPIPIYRQGRAMCDQKPS